MFVSCVSVVSLSSGSSASYQLYSIVINCADLARSMWLLLHNAVLDSLTFPPLCNNYSCCCHGSWLWKALGKPLTEAPLPSSSSEQQRRKEETEGECCFGYNVTTWSEEFRLFCGAQAVPVPTLVWITWKLKLLGFKMYHFPSSCA